MPKINSKLLIKDVRSRIPRVVGFGITYLLVLEVVTKIPYINLQTIDWQWKMFIVFLLFIGWFNPKYYLLMIINLVWLIFGKFSEMTGVLIYISLLIVFIKLLLDRKAAVD